MSERLNVKKMKSSESSLSSDLIDSENHDSDIDSAIFQLEMVHIELDKLNEKENDEILTIEQKYKKLRQHYFNKRTEIIESIPDFWSTVFTSHPGICHILYEDEEDCLRHLQKLEVETADNIKSGYSIKLYFNENPYFKNDVLVKEFFYKQGQLSSISTKIEWKKPHPSTSSSKEGTSKSARKRSHSSQQTFFGWFANNEDASSDIIAEIIKDDIWVNSLHYYLVPDPDMEGNNDKEDDSTDSSSSDFEEEEMFESSQEKSTLQRSTGEGASTSK
ncbi:protein SETSIP isoform X2 [Tribolium castaneum]|nr:PREDICTED: protein SETSIP isoform X2 [Tribolium castaneum]|eukprot:XP_015832999.1 PREDICTED: protein SETSIP isoform X2 [Tribolium castaneum]